MKKRNVAVIFTCFNRKEKTLNCIKKLNIHSDCIELDFYICDDLSTDGTYDAVINLQQSIHIFQSEGNLFWCRGMYEAMLRAKQTKHDIYLMVNDDVDFFANAIDNLLDFYDSKKATCAVVGSTISQNNAIMTYGGLKLVYPRRRIIGSIQKTNLVTDITSGNETCDLANWNCFLIDEKIFNEVGLIDSKYQHGLGDFDYSCRIKNLGYKIFIYNEPIGYCERNSNVGGYKDKTLPINERLKKLVSEKGIPLYSHYRYYLKNFGCIGVIQLTWVYLKYLMLILFKKEI